MFKKIILSTALVLLLLILTGCQLFNRSSRKDREASYKIGGIIPLTGNGAALGQSYAQGVDMAVDEINAEGGIGGHQLEFLLQDSKVSGADSVSAARFLLDTENPDIFLSMFTITATAISPILKEAKKPGIYQIFSRSVLENNLYVFKTHFDSLTGCEQLTEYAKEKGKYKKLGAIMALAEYSELCLQGAKNIDPDIKDYRYSFGEKDFRPFLVKAQAEGVDTILFTGIDQEFKDLFRQLTELNSSIKVICALAFECIPPETVKSIPAIVLDGVLGVDVIPLDINNSEFAEKYKSKYPEASFIDYSYAAMGYEDVMYVSKAMGSCQPGDSECLTKALENVSGYKSVLGSRGFKNRILQLDNRIYEFKDGAWQLAG